MYDKTPPLLVSVYMPTHNRCKLLQRSLDSILSQTYKNIEIVIVNDGSTDDTEKFILEYKKKYPQIQYYKHDTPKGANAARNFAIRQCRGEFVTGFDDDDEMYPERIEKMLNAYNDKYAFVYTGYEIVSSTDIKYNIPEQEIVSLDDAINRCPTSQVLTTKDMFFNAGLFDESMIACQDYDMWIRMLKIKPKAKAIQEPLFKVYVGHERISSNRLKGDMQFFFKHKKLMTKKRRTDLIVAFRLAKKKQITSFKMLIFMTRYYPWKQKIKDKIKQLFS